MANIILLMLWQFIVSDLQNNYIYLYVCFVIYFLSGQPTIFLSNLKTWAVSLKLAVIT